MLLRIARKMHEERDCLPQTLSHVGKEAAKADKKRYTSQLEEYMVKK